MSNFAKYIFAPWVRQGLSNSITEVDHLGGGNSSALERAEIAVKLNWTGNSINKTAQLIGPGDIKSISEDAILKVSPLEFSRDMEGNYLPYIEFYEEDFPWRYTPASATDNIDPLDSTAKTRLRPWLALIVLEDDNGATGPEFEFPKEQNGQVYVTITANLTDVIHSANEHWAWAHVQYNPDASDPIGSNAVLKGKIKADPDRSLSRILCPRQLAPGKNYKAFLVPAFETGRLAGIGEDVTTTPAQMSSWGNTGTTREADFPVYKEWSFTTSTEGDFETLAKRLKPEPFSGEDGRDMAITNSGYGVTHVTTDRNVKLEGALKPIDGSENQWPNEGNDNDYIRQLSDVLNLNESLNPIDSNATSPTLSGNPFSTTPILDDPIVSPPLYGQWHFINSSVPNSLPVAGTDKWFSQVNLNPSWRAAAGIGTKVIRENQEDFMERAWQQIGEVNAANEKIRIAELMKWTNGRINDKRIRTMPIDRFMKVSSSLMKRTQNGNGKSLYGELSESRLPNAVMDNGFRKLTRARGVVAKKASKAANLSHPTLLTEKMVSSFDGVQGVVAGNETKAAAPFSPASTSPAPATSTKLVSWESTLNSFYEPIPPEFDLDIVTGGARAKIEKRANPFTQVSRNDGFSFLGNLSVLDRKVVSQISGLNASQTAWSPIENRRPIMTYPKFEDILGDYLKKMDVEYILPGVGKIEENSVTLMQTNPKFIESFFLGLNHEMSRELLWREYPTDQRGTYFRQFWDKQDSIDNGVTSDDIKEIHEWDGELGTNTTTGGGSGSIVLVIRGDLLKKYPDAIIYAQKAGIPDIGDGIELAEGNYERTDEALPLDASLRQHPIFSITLNPDITILGFDLTLDDVKNELVVDPINGSTSGQTGWYFVFAERPGKPRFGLDIGSAPSLDSWSDLAWDDLQDPDHIVLSNTGNTALAPANNEGIEWKASSAEMAYITFQKPALVAIHAEKMLPLGS